MAAELPKDQVKSIYVSETFAKDPENAAILAEYQDTNFVSDSVFCGDVRHADAPGCAGTCQTVFLRNGRALKE